MSKFNEATRVQMPAMVHLTRIGYRYFGKISEEDAGKVYDPSTNILLEVFTSQFERLNPDYAGMAKQILKHIVDNKIIHGVVSMPSNVFANTGTNVSVLFFDNSKSSDKVILIDASKLGEEYKEGNNQKKRLRPEEIDKIVNTFRNREAEDGFSVSVSYDEIKEKGYSLSAGQYFDIKIEYVDITEEEFNRRMADYETKLTEMFAESHRLEAEILAQLKTLKFNG